MKEDNTLINRSPQYSLICFQHARALHCTKSRTYSIHTVRNLPLFKAFSAAMLLASLSLQHECSGNSDFSSCNGITTTTTREQQLSLTFHCCPGQSPSFHTEQQLQSQEETPDRCTFTQTTTLRQCLTYWCRQGY